MKVKMVFMKNSCFRKLFSKCINKPSAAVICLSLAIITTVNISYENWNHEYKIIAHDVNSYYAYLPMIFIYGDPAMKFIDDFPEKAQKHYWVLDTPAGKRAIITSMGLAYLFTPFFLAGHAIAQFTPFAGDEFSAPYKISLIISCLFYLTIGLIFLRKVLRRYFSEGVTAITLVIITFGTNLLHYVTEEPTMTHAFNFSMFSVFIFMTERWFERPGVKNALLTGALAGLITLVRPSNVIVILLLVFWGIASFNDFIARISFYLKRWYLVLLMIMAFIMVWVPQFWYWHYTSGSVLFNTYSSVGAGFFFDNPQIYHTLFSYRKGWFVYTPVMIFIIPGLIFLYRQHRRLFLPILVFLLVNIYVISSWWCWWYGGGFGLRSFIDSYALMAIPLAAFITWTIKRKQIIKWLLLIFLAGAVYLNVFQVRQYKRGFLHYVSMSKASYWAVFHSFSPDRNYWNNLVFPDYPAARSGKYYTENEITELERREAEALKAERIREFEEKIRNNPAYMFLIEEKASRWDISIDSVIKMDAGWLYRDRYEKKKSGENPLENDQ